MSDLERRTWHLVDGLLIEVGFQDDVAKAFAFTAEDDQDIQIFTEDGRLTLIGLSQNRNPSQACIDACFTAISQRRNGEGWDLDKARKKLVNPLGWSIHTINGHRITVRPNNQGLLSASSSFEGVNYHRHEHQPGELTMMGWGRPAAREPVMPPASLAISLAEAVKQRRDWHRVANLEWKL